MFRLGREVDGPAAITINRANFSINRANFSGQTVMDPPV